jgi:hypothetical protein
MLTLVLASHALHKVFITTSVCKIRTTRITGNTKNTTIAIVVILKTLAGKPVRGVIEGGEAGVPRSGDHRLVEFPKLIL